MRLLPAALAALSLSLLLPAAASAAPTLDRIGSFDAPVFVAAPPGDGRLFVVEREGTVRVVGRDGRTKPDPFLDLRSQTTTDGERGLLSIAFPPDYASSGLVYVYMTANDGSIQIRELRRSAADPDRVDPGAGRVVISQAHAQFSNHNGGTAQFGPDGLLWLATGDGGSGNDPNGNGQKLTTLLGKVLRIDPRATATGPYGVPGDNPFVGRTDARAEIWAYGVRNPYRFSFDRETGDLWIADVGQETREEVDLARAADGRGRGANYGWRCFEGKIRNPGVPVCEAPGHVPPLFDLDQERDGVCSITGGVVVRDPGLPTLAGRYVYADLCRPEIYATGSDGSPGRGTGLSVSSPVGFGEDACGRVYAVSIEGPVSRLRDGTATACDLPEAPAAPPGGGGSGGDGTGGGGTGGGETGGGSTGTPPGPGPGGTGADTTACRIAIRRPRVQRPSRRRAVRLAVTVSERCTVRATLRVKGVARLRSRARTLEGGRRSTLKVRLRGRGGAKVRRALARRSRQAVLTVTARDAAGNRSSDRRRVRLRAPRAS